MGPMHVCLMLMLFLALSGCSGCGCYNRSGREPSRSSVQVGALFHVIAHSVCDGRHVLVMTYYTPCSTSQRCGYPRQHLLGYRLSADGG